MRTWNDWSDYEINKKVGVLRRLKVASSYECIVTGACYLLTDTYGMIIPYNPCNSWNDAGVLMVDNAIRTVAENGKLIGATTSSQQYYEPYGDVVYSHDNENPCRAVAIVFLMMNGVEENGE